MEGRVDHRQHLDLRRRGKREKNRLHDWGWGRENHKTKTNRKNRPPTLPSPPPPKVQGSKQHTKRHMPTYAAEVKAGDFLISVWGQALDYFPGRERGSQRGKSVGAQRGGRGGGGLFVLCCAVTAPCPCCGLLPVGLRSTCAYIHTHTHRADT